MPLPSPAPDSDHFAHREGVAREVWLPSHEAALLQAACDRQGVTLFSGLLTGFLVLLCGYGDQRDLVVATPTAGRREAGSHRLIGCFVNTVLLRLDLRDNPSLAQLTLRCQDTVREALGRERVALTDVVSRLPRTTTNAMGRPANVMLVQNNAPFDPSEFAGLRAERHRMPPSAVQRDWTVNVAQTDSGLQGEFEHAAHFSDRDIAVAQQRLTTAWRLVATALDTPFEEAVRETAEHY
ncbi:condensation domain-containing protein [Streptomyces sp. NPDC051172]|uniref:condensation domain-containing protein n=1 Tax=Streptomyces sp. NPDC051172 TaxID=3155796 RepID=UPI003446891A